MVFQTLFLPTSITSEWRGLRGLVERFEPFEPFQPFSSLLLKYGGTENMLILAVHGALTLRIL